jgi:hypothetical protein
MIVVCPHCRKSFKGREESRGKQVKCPSCGKPFIVGASGNPGPAPRGTAARTDAAEKIVVSCPKCAKRFKAPAQWSGRQCKCPGCNTVFTAVALTARPPAREEPSKAARTAATQTPRVEKTRLTDRTKAAGTSAATSTEAGRSEPTGKKPLPKTIPTQQPRPDHTGKTPSQVKQEDEVFPWEPNPGLVARVQSYMEKGVGQSWECQSRETLRFAKDEALGAGMRSRLWVFDDAVVVDGVPLNFLMRLLLLLLQLPAILLSGPFAILMAIPVLFMQLLLLPIGFLLAWIEKARYESIARRIRSNPRSPYAVRKLFQLTPLMPRYWQRGDVVQLIRVNVRRSLCGVRSVLLLVQDNPITSRPGCMDLLLPGLFPRRRIYVVCLKGGLQDADEAAAAASKALALTTIDKAVVARNKLVLA